MMQAVVLLLATVLAANMSKNVFGLELTVGKEVKSISMKKHFLENRIALHQ